MRLPDDVLKKITGKKWYHQRFDGSPLFIYSIAKAELRKEDRKPAGTEADIRVCFFSDGRADWYLDMADIDRGAQAVVDMARENSEVSSELLAAWKVDEDTAEKFFVEEFPIVDVSALSDSELAELWNRYYELFVTRFTSSSVIDHFALGTDLLINNMLKEEVGETDTISEFTEIFSIATAPVHQSFINSAEIDLLKIAAGKSDESLEDYRKKYFWTKNNYVLAQELTVEHFQEEIDAWNEGGKDLAEVLQKIETTPEMGKKKKTELFNKYNFSPLLLRLLKISEDFTWWQDERKRATYFNIHIGTKLIEEVARRKGYAVEPLKYAYDSEIETIISAGVPSMQDLQQRRKFSVFIYTPEAIYIEIGNKAEEIREMMLGSQALDDVDDIRGLSASTGKAIGTAKVVESATEVEKVEQGDILVAVMTRPDYVPAMKKAAAIVTDEGGVTSHAAIVSRELGIPCIIGTKIATSVFKDGDKVEVNANHGWVRKIKLEE